MNQLTTIASLPSGGGCKSAMTAEDDAYLAFVQENIKRDIAEGKITEGEGWDRGLAAIGHTVLYAACRAKAQDRRATHAEPPTGDSTGIYAFEEGGLVRIGDVAKKDGEA